MKPARAIVDLRAATAITDHGAYDHAVDPGTSRLTTLCGRQVERILSVPVATRDRMFCRDCAVFIDDWYR